MQDEFDEVWNVSTLDNKTDEAPEVWFLTNNALENYNRHFNHIVPNSHPNLVVFSNALQKEAASVSQRMKNVWVGCETAPTYAGANFTPIPDDFDSFRYRVGAKVKVGIKAKAEAVAKKQKTRRVKNDK
jgi:hypothetical protein